MSLSDLFSRHADCWDNALRFGGLFISIFFGASTPAVFALFGLLVDEFGEGGFSPDKFKGVEKYFIVLVYVALIVGFIMFIQSTTLNLFSRNITNKTKLLYFQECLKKDGDFYDRHNPAEIPSKMAKET